MTLADAAQIVALCALYVGVVLGIARFMALGDSDND